MISPGVPSTVPKSNAALAAGEGLVWNGTMWVPSSLEAYGNSQKPFAMDTSTLSTPGNIGVASEPPGKSVTTNIFGSPSYNHFLVQAASRIQFAAYPRRRGKGSLRLEVQSEDVDKNGVKERVEITGTAATTLYRPGESFWEAHSFLFPSHTVQAPEGTGWFLFFQKYAQEVLTEPQISGGSPPFALEMTKAGEFLACVRGGEKERAENVLTEHTGLLGTATLSVWHDFLVHFVLSTTGTGIVEVWHRVAGQQFSLAPQFAYTGPNVITITGPEAGTHAPAQLPAYPCACIYRKHRTQPQVIYYGGSTIRRSRREAEAFWSDTLIDETTHLKQIHASGKTSAEIDALFEQEPHDEMTVLDLDENKPMYRQAGTWTHAV